MQANCLQLNWDKKDFYVNVYQPQATPTSDLGPDNSSISVPTGQLAVPSTVRARAIPIIAGNRIWNGLPADVTSEPSLTVFRQRLKTVLLCRSYQNIYVLELHFSDSGPSNLYNI